MNDYYADSKEECNRVVTLLIDGLAPNKIAFDKGKYDDSQIEAMMACIFQRLKHMKNVRDYEPLVRAAIRVCNGVLKDVSERLRDDWSLVSLAVNKEGPDALQWASERLRSHPALVGSALTRGESAESALLHVPDRMRSDRKFVKDLLFEIKHMSPAGRHLAGVVFLWASEEIRFDRKFIVELMRTTPGFSYVGARIPSVIRFAPAEVRRDRSLFLAMVALGRVDTLCDFDTSLCCDRKMVLQSYRRHRGALDCADQSLLSDRSFIEEAMRIRNEAYKFASQELRMDEDFARWAFQSMKIPFDWISYYFKRDKAFVLGAIAAAPNRAYEILRYTPDELTEDFDVVYAAVCCNGKALYFSGDMPRADKTVVLAAVRKYGEVLGSAHESFFNDRDVVRAAAEHSPSAFRFAADELKEDPEFVWEAVRKDGRVLPWVSTDIADYKAVVIQALKTEQVRLASRKGNFLPNPIKLADKSFLASNETWATDLLWAGHPDQAKKVVLLFVRTFQNDEQRDRDGERRLISYKEVEDFIDAMAFMSATWKDRWGMHECIEDAMRILTAPKSLLGKRDRATWEAFGIAEKPEA